MDLTQNAGDSSAGLGFTSISIISGLFAFIPNNLELWLRSAAAGIAILSGCAAVTYYVFAIIEKRLTIKKLKDDVRNSRSDK